MNNSSFPDRTPGNGQDVVSKDYYLIKSIVERRIRTNRLVEDYDVNLLGGLRYKLDKTREILNSLRLPWMKLADAFFQGYVDSSLLGKKKRLLASRLVELMAKLSGENSFIEMLLDYNVSQIKEIEELQVTCKEEMYYSVTIGDDLLYNLTMTQLVEIHDLIEMFLERRDISFHEYEDEDLYAVNMGMSVSRFVDKDFYSVSYGLETYEGEIRFTSSEQMKYVAEQIQCFLDSLEGERIVENDVEDFFISVREDSTPREHVLKETPIIFKDIRQCDEESLTENYTISANGRYLNSLSVGKLKRVSIKLEEFLNSVDREWRNLRIPLKQLEKE